MRVGEALAGPGGGNCRLLRGQHDVIQSALRRGELAVSRKSAGDVAGIAVEFAAGVNQAQIAVLELGIAGAVMQHAGIGACRHDAAVGRELRAVAAELVQQLGLQVVFAQTALDTVAQQGRRGLHGAHMGTGRNLAGTPQDGDFMAVFDKPHLVEHLAQIMLAARAFGAKAHAGPHLMEPAIHLRLQPLVRGKRKPHCRLVGEQLRHGFFKCFHAERLAHPQGGRRGLGAQPDAVPDFTLQVLGPAKQRALARSLDGQPGARFTETGEVIKVTVVAVRKVAVAVARHFGRRGQQGDTATGSFEGARHSGAAFFVNTVVDHGVCPGLSEKYLKVSRRVR